jgi:hypothetical protein
MKKKKQSLCRVKLAHKKNHIQIKAESVQVKQTN